MGPPTHRPRQSAEQFVEHQDKYFTFNSDLGPAPNPPSAGVDIEGGAPRDLGADGITDVYSTKWWAVKLAADAAVTVLRIDQIIMSKQAGGPKPRGPGGDDD